MVVCPAGFTSDHLEILYDLDIEARRVAGEAGVAFARTASLNAEPRMCAALAELVVRSAETISSPDEPASWPSSAVGSAGSRRPGCSPADSRSSGRARRRMSDSGAVVLPTATDLEEVEVVVLEADERFGGKILSGEFQGRPIDFGPDNFLTRDPSAAELCRQLGLGDDLVPPATSSASVLARGRLRPLPAGLVLGIPTDLQALARSGIVSAPGLARAALDLVAPGAPIRASSLGLRPADGRSADTGRRAGQGAATRHGDRGRSGHAASILERRLGREVVERLVDPLLGGINAGSTDQLSLAVVAPQVAQHLVGQRSVMHALAAMLARPASRRSRSGGGGNAVVPRAAGRARPLVEALVADLEDRDVSLRTRSR